MASPQRTDDDLLVRLRHAPGATRVGGRRRRVALLVIAIVVVVAIAAQLVLPMIAEHDLTASLARNGSGVSVSISAFPAEELLFGEADTVTVRIARLSSGSRHVGNLLARTAKIGTLEAHVGVLDTHGLVLHDVTLRTRGSTLTASATVSRAAIEAVLPVDFTLVPSRRDDGIVLNAALSVLGQHLSADARVQAQNGAIVLHPDLPGLVGALDGLHLTVFSNPAVSVDQVAAQAAGAGYRLTADAHYR